MATDVFPIAPARAVERAATTYSVGRSHKGLEVWLIRVLMIVLCAASFFPILYVVLYSVKGGGPALYSRTFIPQSFTLDHYRELFQGQFPTWVMNSLIFGISCGVIQVVFATTAAYAFSRMRFPGRRYGILGLLVLQMLPANLAAVAYFRMLQEVGLYNSRIGIIAILGFGGSALAVWLMKNFMDSIPKDLDEAAYLDGASQWRTFWTIIFPLVQPMLVAQFIFTFIGIYNEYILTTVLLADPSKFPLGVGVRTFSTAFNTNWTVFCAAAVAGSVPILIVFFLAQRFLVEGLTRGAIKG
ncbi:MAG: sugar ABC transporter permease [Chloroflexota bacterium]|nr:sugar ABC transporter permease [Chloroflexota bacterium]